jgi:bacillopeptidase F
MKYRLELLLFSYIALLAVSPALAGEYSPVWPEFLADRQGNQGMVTGIITMAEQVDLRALQDKLYAQKADRQTWHKDVVMALRDKAAATQADIVARLENLAQTGQVSEYRALWVANIITVSAERAVFDELVARSDVLAISPDYPVEIIEPVSKGGDSPTIAGHEIGLERIHADDVWAMGITGSGTLVSHLDSGVDGAHPALASRWAGLDSVYEGHPEWAWFDYPYHTDFPVDYEEHGTHTMGTITGLGEDTGDTVGVAFGARWISASLEGCTLDDILLCFQWIADPDGNPETVWDVPDVCSNSWGLINYFEFQNCDTTYWRVIDGCEAAGVVVLFAAGNEGPDSTTLRRPADRATTDFNCFAVGAVDGSDPEMQIADFSSRGPTYCRPDSSLAIKPEIAGPGVNVRSSVPGGGYQDGWAGTSMACPHVAGVVALMRQANPNLTSEQVKRILLATADDRGGPGDDNAYGAGVVNAYEAVMAALQWGQPCRYISGDVNADSLFNGLDVVYMVSYLKGGPSPIYICECTPDNHWFVAGDINGTCAFEGVDVTYAVRYLRGGPVPQPCPDCPPHGL